MINIIGFKAFQTAQKGSIFMQMFCALLQKDGDNNSVEDIMRDTIAAVHSESRYV